MTMTTIIVSSVTVNAIGIYFLLSSCIPLPVYRQKKDNIEFHVETMANTRMHDINDKEDDTIRYSTINVSTAHNRNDTKQ